MAFDSTKTTLVARTVEAKIDRIKNEILSDLKQLDDVSKSDIEQKIRSRFKDGGIDNEVLKYVGLAFSFDEGSSYLESGVSAYCAYLADNLHKKKEKKTENSPKSIRFIQLDSDKLKNLNGPALEEYICSCLLSADMNPALLDTPISNFQNLNMDFQMNLPNGGTLRQAMTECAKKTKVQLLSQENKLKRTDVIPAHLQNLLNEDMENAQSDQTIIHELQKEDPTLAEQMKEQRNQENKDKPVQKPSSTKSKDEEEFDISEIGEGTSDINYFVGYNKEEVGGLFRNKPELVKYFSEFVARFNKLMNRLLNQELGDDTVDMIQNDIDPEFLKVAAECSKYGAEGAQIQNLCRGMVAIFNRTCDAEKEGKNIDGLKLKANLETTQALDHTDRDGLRREQTTKDGNGKTSIVKAIDNSVGSNGLIQDALTEEDQREIGLFGITGILTHSAMEAFRREPEYELLQNMNMLGLSKDDGRP